MHINIHPQDSSSPKHYHPPLAPRAKREALTCYAKPEHVEPGADDSFLPTNGVRANQMLHQLKLLPVTQD